MSKYIDLINASIKWGKDNVEDFRENEISDGYHDFDELYEFRKVYNAVLFNEWAKQGKYQVHKSKRHFDGGQPFNQGGWFIVSALLPSGLISNHYKIWDWDLFKIPETDKAIFPYDAHTSKDVLERLKQIINHEQHHHHSPQ